MPADFDRSTDIWQSEETDRIHADKQRGRNGRNDDVHHCRHPTANGSADNSVRWPGHRPAASHLTGIGNSRNKRDDAWAAWLKAPATLH